MKFSACVCILSYFLVTGSAFPRPGRPHPLWGSGQQTYTSNNDFLTMAMLMGFDFNELLALTAATNGQFSNNMGGYGNMDLYGALSALVAAAQGPSGRLAQQRARQDMNLLSLLGIVDGADVPDGPAAGGRGGRRGGRRGGPPKAGGGAAAGGEGGPGGEAAEGAAPAAGGAKPKRRGPRRQAPGRVGPKAG